MLLLHVRLVLFGHQPLVLLGQLLKRKQLRLLLHGNSGSDVGVVEYSRAVVAVAATAAAASCDCCCPHRQRVLVGGRSAKLMRRRGVAQLLVVRRVGEMRPRSRTRRHNRGGRGHRHVNANDGPSHCCHMLKWRSRGAGGYCGRLGLGLRLHGCSWLLLGLLLGLLLVVRKGLMGGAA